VAAFRQRYLAVAMPLEADQVGVAEPTWDGRRETLIANTISGRGPRRRSAERPGRLRMGAISLLDFAALMSACAEPRCLAEVPTPTPEECLSRTG